MGRQGLIAAHIHGQQLPIFKNLAEAKLVLLERRDALRGVIEFSSLSC